MFNLIKNENMKIYKRARTWIMFSLMLVCILIVAFVGKYDTLHQKRDSEWRKNVQQEIAQNEEYLKEEGVPKAYKANLENEIEINKYRLEHDVKPANRTVWGNVLNNSAGFIQLITIFVCIIAGDIVASEFTQGTIKLLLIRPVSRTKILLSKYISTLLYAGLLLVSMFAFSFIVGGIFYGFSDAGLPHLYFDDGQVKEGNLILHVLSTYGFNSIQMIMVVTIAFMLSSIFRSSSLGIGFSIFLMFAGLGFGEWFRNFEWGKYYLFLNTDLTPYLNGTPVIEGMTLGFSIMVLAIYFVLFNAFSYITFNKRDVAN